MIAAKKSVGLGSGLLAIALSSLGCGSDEGLGKPSAPPTAAEQSRYGLKVVVQQGGKRSVVRVVPGDLKPEGPRTATRFTDDAVNLPSARAARDATQGVESAPRGKPSAPGLSPLATVGKPDGSTIDTQYEDANGQLAVGTTLLLWAAESCSLEANGSSAFAADYVDEPNLSPTGFFIFPLGIRSCDHGLFYQEILLCAANRLAQVADSVGTVTWSTKQPGAGGADITVSVPPQATEDRFIARDAALSALAHLARAQLITPNPEVSWGTATCLDEYAKEADTGTVPAARWLHPNFYGEARALAHFEPFVGNTWSWLSSSQLQEVGKARLQQQVAISSAAQSLVQELTERSFEDDLAGAEKLKAAAGDPAQGIAAFWGASDATPNPYNTMRHALRLLFGRLEMDAPLAGGAAEWNPTHTRTSDIDDHGKMSRDPACYRDSEGAVSSIGAAPGFHALQAMDALGGGFENRFADIAPATAQQARTISMLERAGIVLPACFEQVTAAQYREAVRSQLVRNAAKAAGATYNAFKTTPQADAISSLVSEAELSDSELRFALDRVQGLFLLIARSYRQCPNGLGDTDHLEFAAVRGKMTLASDSPEVSALSGAVVVGGLSRQALQGDVMSVLGGAQISGDCGYDVAGGSAAHDYASHSAGQVAAFQDVFSLSGVLHRQLGILQERAKDLSLHDIEVQAAFAVAQGADWAGGRVLHYNRGSKYRLMLSNLPPEALGLKAVADFSARLRLVPTRIGSGAETSIYADCVAGTRSAGCPTLPSLHAPDAGTPVAAPEGTLGFSTQAFELAFDTAPLDFEGFLVTQKDASTGEAGRVLGFVSRVYTGSDSSLSSYAWSRVSSIVVSPVQRRMAEQLFGLRPLDKAQRTCANSNPTSLPGEYCNLQMKRDMFVPLANELTSEGTGTEDSWKHYLRVAEEASAKADELGRQLIELGLRSDERQEGGVEAVGELCGSYPIVDSIEVASGAISTPKDDAAVAECIDSAPIDIVFLGADPFEQYRGNPTLADAEIRKKYCCPSTGSCATGRPPGFKPAAFCSKSTLLKHEGLGLVAALQPAAPPAKQDCDKLLTAFDPVATDATMNATAFGDIVGSSWATQARLARTMAASKLQQFQNGEWVLLLKEKPVLASSYVAVSRSMFGMPEGELDVAQQMVLAGVKPYVWPLCTSAMGGCQGAAGLMSRILGDPGDATHAYGPLLERVEQMLFMLGGLSGSMPAGAVQMYLPAIDRIGPDSVSAGPGFDGPVPLPVLYGAGHFKTIGGTTQLTAEGFKGRGGWHGEETLVGNAIAVDPGYAANRKARAYLPAWLQQTYDQMATGPAASSYLLLHAESAEIPFSKDLPVPDGTPGAPDSGRSSYLTSWLQQVAQKKADAEKNGACALGDTAKLLNRAQNYSKFGWPSHYTANGTLPFVTREICAKSAHVYSVFEEVVPSPAELDQSLFPIVTFQNDGCSGCDHTFSMTEVVGESGEGCGGFFENDEYTSCRNFSAFIATTERCSTISKHWETAVNGDCETYAMEGWLDPMERRRLTHDRLRPSQCSPPERIEMFLSKGASDDCQAMQNVVRALALSCVAETTTEVPVSQGPPPIESVEDIEKLAIWIDRASLAMELVLQGTYLVDLPASVVEAAKRDRPDDEAASKGERGKLLLELGKNINDIQQGMVNVTNEFRRLRSAVEKAQIDIDAADISLEAADLSLAMQKLEIDRQLIREKAAKSRAYMDAVVGGLGAGTSAGLSPVGTTAAGAAMLGGPWGFAVAAGVTTVTGLWQAAGISADLGQDIALLEKQRKILDDSDEPNNAQHENRIRDAVHTLGDAQASIYESLESDFTQLDDGRSNVLINLNSLRTTQSKARIALAKASGADLVKVGDQVVPLHVNTVLRRQFGVLKERYDRALLGAKRASYLARLAIEERLGVRMSDLREAIGPIEAPALWIDDLCSVQGIDYNALRTAGDAGGTSGTSGGPAAAGDELDLVKGFADQYIGDYVSRLKELVEFYNLRYPFSEGRDAALVSLRESLGNLEQQCLRESNNLLFFSDRLDATAPDERNPVGGWRATGCTETECLAVRSGSGLTKANGAELIAPGGGGATWLLGTARSTTDPFPPQLEPGPAAPESVYQTVALTAGKGYVLSWWDSGRASSGGPLAASATPAPYWVAIVDSRWQTVAYQEFTPSVGDAWSDRLALAFPAPEDGDYHIAFGVGQTGHTGASVAVANVQLEATRFNLAAGTAYESTNSSRTILSAACGSDGPAGFRRRFNRTCDDSGCWYELRDMLVVDTELLDQGVSSLVGKVAAGNYNYRNDSVALNLVGSGVLNCANGRPSCYGEAYVEYDLTHFAFNVPMTDYVGDVRCFNFGAGRINRGKGLAAERYLTTPLGSADSDLVNQPAFLKHELSGRPLSGAYRLRIKESPALVWEAVEDIQVLFNYGYWSRVDLGPGQ